MSRFRDANLKLLCGFVLLGLPILGLVGCNMATQVEVVDLNKVLDALAAVLDEGDTENGSNGSGVEAAVGIAPVTTENEDAAKQDEFLQKFAARLNERKLTNSPIGVMMTTDGSIEGFTDPNNNMTKDAGEKKLFAVQIDAEQNRLIASDTNDYHRDHRYRPRMGGLFTGYMLGSMLGRQNNFYTGRSKPQFDSMKMSPKNYHSNVVAATRAKARSTSSRSARSRGGSRGFSFGK